VVDRRALAAEVAALLEDLGVAAVIDCGPRVRVVTAGERVACTLSGARVGPTLVADTGLAFARIAADGTADIELALGAAAVAARTTESAIAELEALSRALDRDDVGDEDDDADFGFDAAP
jgi:hypothetical protein